MTPADTPCELCSLPVGVKPFSLSLADRSLHFCCEGCRGIYQMLHDIKEIPSASVQNDTDFPERSSP